MAQLSDDCFALGEALLSVEQAVALIAARVAPLAGEAMATLPEALGRVLARDLVAPLPLPPFANSAVDGYAFRHADLAPGGATELRLAGRIAAGEAGMPLGPGGAARIFTGAPLPAGADTVLMQEDAGLGGDGLLVPPGLPAGANARAAGEDVAAGAVALPAGSLLGPAEIGLAAALGFAALPLRPLLRVGVFSTGDELAAPGAALGPAQTYDSNRFTLMGLLRRLPVAVSDLGILADRRGATATALAAAAARHDLLLTSGGVSMGEEDHVRAALESVGRLVFWRLAVKPGRPAAMGMIGGTPVIGLPGNPVAAVVTFLHLARPLVLRRAGALPQPLPRLPAQAGFSHRKKPGRREYLPVTLDGAGVAHRFPRAGAGLLSSLTGSNAFAELEESVEAVAPGDGVVVLPFAGVF
jgi:molybdopterin molybdotransferase